MYNLDFLIENLRRKRAKKEIYLKDVLKKHSLSVGVVSVFSLSQFINT